MIEELSLQCPYKVTLDPKNQTYLFTTINGIEYQLAFIDFVGYFSGTSTEDLITKVFSLNIDKLTDKVAPTDRDVQVTIECIVTHFFEDRENSLVYVCDHSDEKHAARKRKFNKWFHDSVSKDEFIKLDDVVNTPDGVHYTSVIFHIENPFRQYVETGYYEVIETLNKEE
jgi:Family of unknown function (DUF6169)